MKILHLADLHLGRSLKDYDLLRDQEYITELVLDTVRERGVDAVILAGDIYDKTVPSEAAVNLLDSFLSRLADSGAETYLISGNHDSDDRLHFGSRLFEERHIHIAAGFAGALPHYVLRDEHGPVNIFLLPFVKASQVRRFYPEEELLTYEAAVRCILRHAGISFEERNVLAAHQFVAGPSGDPEAGGSEGLSVRNVGLVERIGAGCFDGFDYVALGHIHAPQAVGRESVRYAGSPLKYSLSEAGHRKSMPLITLGAKGETEVELIPIRPLRDLRHLQGRLKDLLDPKNITDPEDFIYATLTEEHPVDNVMEIFRQHYPNTVAVDYRTSGRTGFAEAESEETEQMSFDELIGAFYERIYGEEMTEEERSVMRAAAKEAGVYHEAD